LAKLIISEEFGKAFIPKKFRPFIREYFLKAGFDQVPYRFFGYLFYLTVLVTGVIYIFWIFPVLGELKVKTIVFLLSTFTIWVAVQLFLLLLAGLLIYAILDMRIYNRKKKMEEVLQEFLRYVSENLKGGMSIENALWDAIRPKFGVLAHEIRLAAKRVMTGQDVDEALTEFSLKYDSPMLKRSFALIIEGIRGGSELAELIDKIQHNLRETRELKKEISATNYTFIIFMSIIALVISPLLFGLSINLLMILNKLTSTLFDSTTSGAGMMFTVTGFAIDPDTFNNFALGVIMVSSGFIALITSILKNGSPKDGFKYVPLYILGSIIAFMFFKNVFYQIFSSITMWI
jgi:Flp pilus assembly protein TadB